MKDVCVEGTIVANGRNLVIVKCKKMEGSVI